MKPNIIHQRSNTLSMNVVVFEAIYQTINKTICLADE